MCPHNGVIRPELTLECPNTAEKSLYEKHESVTEARKTGTMKVNGTLVDEYSMAKMLIFATPVDQSH